VHRVLLVLFVLIAVSCSHKEELPVETDYGDIYFHIDCYWPDPQEVTSPALWRCYEDINTELLSGFLFLELESEISLYFCGENLELRSGIDIYDNLIALITRDKYDCLHITEDKQKGNEFDWSWDHTTTRLQIIWRPEDSVHKMITLIIAQSEYGTALRVPVYYKALN